MKVWSAYNLRICVVPFGPFYLLLKKPDGSVRLHGTLGSMITNVTASLNMTYSIVPPLDKAYGMVEEETGRLTGMLATVLAGKADVAAGPFPVHPRMNDLLHDMARSSDSFTAFGIISGMKNDYVQAPTSFTDAFDSLVSIRKLKSNI